jgi:hypothetical protein
VGAWYPRKTTREKQQGQALLELQGQALLELKGEIARSLWELFGQ